MLDWNLVIQIAGVFLALVGGVLSVPLINWLKTLSGIDGRLAQVVTAVVAAVIAVLTLIVSGAIAPEPLTVEYVGSLFMAVLVASQAEYRRLKDQLKKDGSQ
ncbi:MAG: hypothetical protein IPM39_15130 [Chloroflexi bacterium]|nr:hypothetical protein [Chloroflexota bacterium]